MSNNCHVSLSKQEGVWLAKRIGLSYRRDKTVNFIPKSYGIPDHENSLMIRVTLPELTEENVKLWFMDRYNYPQDCVKIYNS